MIGKKIGNLEIISEIGQGGMGVVYLAENVNIGKKFAVKCLAPELTLIPQFRDRFFREARNQANLDHPNIVQAIDYEKKDGQYFLIMEFIDGNGLDRLIKEKGKLDEIEALPIVKDVMRGLNFANSRGIIHRDIKSSNIIVDKNGTAKIMDFGISILAGDQRLTSTGMNVIGTACYMSPEHIVRPKEIDHRSDVYSLGIVLYEMLTGNLPFDGETDFGIKEMHVKSPPPNPSVENAQISDTLSLLILKALEKDPDDRFNGSGEFLAYIERYEKEKRASGKRKEEERKAKSSSPVKKWIWIFSILTILSAAAGVFYLFEMRSDDEGTLIFESATKDMEVLIDGKNTGPPPLTVKLPFGKHKITLKKKGHVTKELSFVLNSEEPFRLEENLEKMRASIEITSEPASADVIFNGTKLGNTPFSKDDIEEGEYLIELCMDGFKTWKKEISLEPGMKETLSATLELKPALVSLQSDPQGANIILNGNKFGKTPRTIEILKSGTCEIELKMAGYQIWSKKIETEPGREEIVNALLTPKAASIEVTSIPTGASIYIDGKKRAKSPETIHNLKDKKYIVELKKDGFKPWKKSIVLAKGKIEKISVHLEKLKPPSAELFGSIAIRSKPSDAGIYLNGEKTGNTPKTIKNLKAGKYDVVVKKKGYEEWKKTIYLKGEETERIKAELRDVSGELEQYYQTGLKYLIGDGVGKSEKDAVKWFEKAAEGGFAAAQFSLGFCYTKGRGVRKNHSEAIGWFRKAGNQGHAEAQYYTGIFYGKGWGVQKDVAEAVKWIRKAANQDLAEAQYSLGAHYDQGIGVKKDESGAAKWYLKAAKQGHVRSQRDLGIFYRTGKGVRKDDREAVYWLRKAADRKDAKSQYYLGIHFAEGLGIGKDYKEAVIWFMKAAEQGDSNGQYSLGLMYEKGLGVEKNSLKATKWYLQAMKNGNKEAESALKRLE